MTFIDCDDRRNSWDYFDIETVPYEKYWNEGSKDEVWNKNWAKENLYDPTKNKIITIQYQQLKLNSGEPRNDLVILKEWDDPEGEKGIVKKFADAFDLTDKWDFRPTGNNFKFEWSHIPAKLKRYCDLDFNPNELVYVQDLRGTAIIANGGRIRGYQGLFGKSGLAKNIARWYYEKKYEQITNYVTTEADDFHVGHQALFRALSVIPKTKR